MSHPASALDTRQMVCVGGIFLTGGLVEGQLVCGATPRDGQEFSRCCMITYELLHTNASTDSNPDRVHVQETEADVLYVRY